MQKKSKFTSYLCAVNYSILPEIASLPAWDSAPRIRELLSAYRRAVFTAPPGTGKSTALPLALLEDLPAGERILMLEPRRVAARQIAVRMASLLGEPVGRTVGYRIRLESKVSKDTRIEVLTEGILTRMLVEDPTLEGVNIVIFDEFHERSLPCDEAFALTVQTQTLLRDDLSLLILSATLDVEALRKGFNAPVLEGDGKMFPVELLHTAEEATAENAAQVVARTVRQAHAAHEGDILAFLPGEADIRRCAQSLEGGLGKTRVYPLYGQLPFERQKQAIAPGRPGERKIVLATPIAETSLTIEGVRVVVDAGLFRKPVYDSRSGLSRLETVRISRDMAAQRSGRAGRTAPGVCYRLWGKATESRMEPVRKPEITEADLASLVLDIAACGETDIYALPWLTPPPADRVRQARTLLGSLGALTPEGRITPHGKALAAFPAHPRIAQLLLKGRTPELKALASDIAALLQERDPLEETAGCGLDLRVKALREARKKAQRGRWEHIIAQSDQYAALAGVRPDDGPFDAYELGALIAAAYPERIGKAWKEGNGCFQLPSGERAALAAEDALSAAEFLAIAEMTARPGGVGRIFLAAPVAPEDIKEYATERDRVIWDGKAGCIRASRELRIGNLLLEERPLTDLPRETVLKALCEAAGKDGRSMFDFSEAAGNLQRRLATLSAWHPELELPAVDTDTLLERAGEWLPLYAGNASSAAQLKKIDLCAVILGLIGPQGQTAAERWTPSHVTVPTGSRIPLEYRPGAEVPVLRVRLQECFGMLDTPRVDGGRRCVLMELLSPGYKPVQLTSDLRSFWSGTYFEVRKELRRRYPKHAWPEDPFSADPVRGVRRPSKP